MGRRPHYPTESPWKSIDYRSVRQRPQPIKDALMFSTLFTNVTIHHCLLDLCACLPGYSGASMAAAPMDRQVGGRQAGGHPLASIYTAEFSKQS